MLVGHQSIISGYFYALALTYKISLNTLSKMSSSWESLWSLLSSALIDKKSAYYLDKE